MAKKSSGIYRSFALVGSLSWTFIICVVLGAFLGAFLDSTFRTDPLFLLLGIIAGVIVGIWQSYRLIMKVAREDEPGREQNDSE